MLFKAFSAAVHSRYFKPAKGFAGAPSPTRTAAFARFQRFSPRSGRLSPTPTRKVSAERPREALGLMGLATRNVSLNSLTSWL